MNEKYKQEVEAYSDGEMSKKQEKRMEETINYFPTLEGYLDKIEHQKKILKKWWSTQKHN